MTYFASVRVNTALKPCDDSVKPVTAGSRKTRQVLRIQGAQDLPYSLKDKTACGSDARGKRSTDCIAVLRSVWDQKIPQELQGSLCLIAVGSLGRAELGPYSDVDLVVIYDEQVVADPGMVSDFWYSLWDLGFDLDHSVRTITETLEITSQDIPALLGFLNAKPIAGNCDLGENALGQVLGQWRRQAGSRLASLVASARKRAEIFGELAYLIEPNLKESRGGLRDFLVLQAFVATWQIQRSFGAVDDNYNFLLDVRDALQVVAKRNTPRLSTTYQSQVCEVLEISDLDELFGKLATVARCISFTLDNTVRNGRQIVMQRRRHPVKPRYIEGRRQAPVLNEIGPGVYEHENELVFAASLPENLQTRQLCLHIGALSARTTLPISTNSLNTLEQSGDWPSRWDEKARSDFLTILASGPNQLPIWESLDQANVITGIIGDWGKVRNRRQRNPYHQLTVDRHLIEVTARIRQQDLGKQEQDDLLLAAFFHDIGKINGARDHSFTGAQMTRQILSELGFATESIERVSKLVAEHLKFYGLATQKDPHSPEAIKQLAEVINYDGNLLKMLYKLTVADASATGSRVWSNSKAYLVRQLYENTKMLIAGQSM